MIHHTISFLGFYTDNAFPQQDGFWSTPIGMVITGLLFIQSVYKMYSGRIETGFFSTLWHSLMSLVMLCAFVGGLTPHYNPHHIVQTMLMLMGIEALWFLGTQIKLIIEERRNVK